MGTAHAPCGDSGDIEIFSDGEGRRAGAIEVAESDRNEVALGSGHDSLASGIEPRWQGGKLRRDERRRLRGKPAERALIVAMTRRRDRRALVVDLDAKRGGVAEGRLEIGGDPRRV